MNSMFSLEGKNVLIAGGGGDIALACAKGFAEYGANLFLFDNSQEHLECAKEELKKENIEAKTWCGSITDSNFLKEIVSQMPVPDVLFNATGITYRKPLLEMKDEEWSRIIDVNLNGTYYLLRTFGSLMCSRGKGKIIQLLSTGAYHFGANFVAYGASKAATSALIKGLAIEWAPYNININGIAPTATETNFTRDYYNQFPKKKEAVINNHPYKRLGKPEDYVGAAIYLASSASNFVNGEVIVVDSGKSVK